MAPLHRTLIAHRLGLTFWAQWATAMLLSNLLLIEVVQVRYGEVRSEYRVLGVLALLGSVHIYALLQVYHKRHRLLVGIARLLAGWSLLLVCLLAITLLSQTLHTYSPEVLASWAILSFFAQAASYVLLHLAARRHSRRLRRARRAVIVGTGPRACELAERLVNSGRIPLLGMIASDSRRRDPPCPLPVLGDLADLRKIVDAKRVHRVYLALSLEENLRLEGLYRDLVDLPVDVVWVPDLAGMRLLNPSIAEIECLPAIYLNETPRSSHPAALLVKDIVERTLALLAIVALAPLLIVAALAVKLTSPGPVLFKQQRHGWNGEVIQIWKFRTMREHEDELVTPATRGDRRVTPVGRFMRRTSIDELPQLFNVLFGHMALIGPRPHAVIHNHYYLDKIPAYMARHRIKPGMTGLAQITGHRGETETVEKMQQRVDQDLVYINQWSFWLDLKILLKTPFTLISKNIY